MTDYWNLRREGNECQFVMCCLTASVLQIWLLPCWCL
ncbi:unnamed protein product [Linum tenue]|uniref:Uncharacterized protein n=1 Tax=Linum tenue TaxID=586396 RepID=A0AAV0S1A2_9ROSI|nr:unnamed protein product [Linum tenue]